ncbi:hypothetical protein EDI_126900 [Entamoeba dispar SAW760]|uniref:Ras-GEF domain-containing protein n=1 Tax=Entamoeba dispar (strain ATCC PRA-260 / SAW760) TaxID=370354 RepID=B0E8J4_ENTDS|nr:uncharacterized protein EDI_126900 [Entamoeba dispar SAW760]EDR29137.1 hypothetical protein EDI_126900 [Entamoeba dispar SAW760]|eukprot:EDR29137.1 hypothetical protein EDI_126900 [Entamoeba dispar SAW760]
MSISAKDISPRYRLAASIDSINFNQLDMNVDEYITSHHSKMYSPSISPTLSKSFKEETTSFKRKKRLSGLSSLFTKRKPDRSVTPPNRIEQQRMVINLLKNNCDEFKSVIDLVKKWKFVVVENIDIWEFTDDRMVFWRQDRLNRDIIVLITNLVITKEMPLNYAQIILFGEEKEMGERETTLLNSLLQNHEKIFDTQGDPFFSNDGNILTISPKKLFEGAIDIYEVHGLLPLFTKVYQFVGKEKLFLEWCCELEKKLESYASQYGETHCIHLKRKILEILVKCFFETLDEELPSNVKDDLRNCFNNCHYNNTIRNYVLSLFGEKLNEELETCSPISLLVTDKDSLILKKEKKSPRNKHTPKGHISKSARGSPHDSLKEPIGDPYISYVTDEKSIVNVYVDNILTIHPQILARQLTVYDSFNFEKIKIWEFNEKELSNTFISYQKRLDVIILLVKKLITDQSSLQYFITVSRECLLINEFNMSHIIKIVVDEKMKELKLDETQLNINCLDDYRQINELFSSVKNYNNYKKELNSLVSITPRIPVYSFWISDMNGFEISSIHDDPCGMVDFQILTDIADYVNSMMVAQKIPFPYSVNPCFQFFFHSLL